MAHSIDMGHALLGASSSHRWLHCTPSARLEEGIENESSAFAAEGSLAHAYGAKRLKEQLGLDTTAEEAEIAHYRAHETAEMAGHVGIYQEMVWESLERARRNRGTGRVSPELHVEQHLDYSPWVPGGYGTGDAVIVERGKLTVIDLKYGKGVRVLAQDNPQLKLYALGALDIYDYIYDIELVELCICQPRLGHYDRWAMSRQALTDWAEWELRPRAKLAWEGKGETVSGTWCRFCRAKHLCPAKSREAFWGIKN